MQDLNDLYQEVILDHNRRPRNYGPLPDATQSAKAVSYTHLTLPTSDLV